MFGMFKQSINRETVISEIVDNLAYTQAGFTELAAKDGLTRHPNFEEEAGLLIYLAVGIFGIQASTLGHADRQRLSVELTGKWAEKVYGHSNIETVRSLQGAFAEYNRAEEIYGNRNAMLLGCVKLFLQKLGKNSDPNIPSPEALSLAGYLNSMMLNIKANLDETHKRFKIE